MMAKRTYRYEVKGPGTFPFDMLRYDQAKIVAKRRDPEFNSPLRLIYTIVGNTKPTVGRWNSFLWVVIKETK